MNATAFISRYKIAGLSVCKYKFWKRADWKVFIASAFEWNVVQYTQYEIKLQANH